MKKNFTDDEKILRMYEKEQIKDLMARHSYYYSNDQRREELSEIWVQEPSNRRSASLANNFGFYIGMENIEKYYVIDVEKARYDALSLYHEADPSIPCDNLHLGLGYMAHHTVNTPLCYIAEDGKTARYLAYDCGEETTGKPDGTMDAYFVFGLVLADLIREENGFKIWHLVLAHDHTVPVSINYGDAFPIETKRGDDPFEKEFGTPTLARTVYEPFFGWEYLYADMPKPYYTYTDLKSYGPEGELGLPYYEREKREI